jgi:hypothetical protein
MAVKLKVMRLSTAQADITPGPMPMGGYTYPTPRMATGTYSSLHVRVTILWDPGPRAIITLDAGTLPRPWSQALRTRLLALNTWTSAQIVVLCTHTHNGPMTLSSPDPWITYGATDLTSCTTYWNQVSDTVVDTVQDALLADSIPVTLDYQSITQNWSGSRTSPSTYTETAVPVLVARKGDGLPAAVLFGYGCHAVTAGPQTLWDGDYPAAACAVIEAAIPGCHAQFLPGPGGDQDPTYVPRMWAQRNKLGAQIGSAVVGAVITPGRSLTGITSTSMTEMTLPLQVPSTPGGWTTMRASYAARLADPAFGSYPYYLRHAQWAMDQIDANNRPTSLPVPLQVWKLAGAPTLRVAFIGGEPVSGFGLWMRNHYGGVNGAVAVGYANEVGCYLVGDTFFPPYDSNGSYEGGWNTADTSLAGESMCVYGQLGHFCYSPDSRAAEPIILAALTAALA